MTYNCVRVPRCHDFTSFDLNKKITLGCTLGYCVEQESCDCVLALIIKYMNTHTHTDTLPPSPFISHAGRLCLLWLIDCNECNSSQILQKPLKSLSPFIKLS